MICGLVFFVQDKKKTIVLFCFRTKVASTHGDHTVRVSDVATGKCLHILRGHPRTPWCIAFHPTSNQILASGCLGGEVRIWDLHVGVNFLHGRYTCICYHMFNKIYNGCIIVSPYDMLWFWLWIWVCFLCGRSRFDGPYSLHVLNTLILYCDNEQRMMS